MNAKTKPHVVKRVSAVVMSAIIGFSAINTTGFVPWSQPYEAHAATGDIYYDSGTFVLNTTGNTAYNWSSAITDATVINGRQMTVPGTSSTAAVAMTQQDTDVVSQAGNHSYIAKGTESTDGSGNTIVTWEIKAWPTGQDGATLPTTAATIATEWTGTTNYTLAAPDWEALNDWAWIDTYTKRNTGTDGTNDTVVPYVGSAIAKSGFMIGLYDPWGGALPYYEMDVARASAGSSNIPGYSIYYDSAYLGNDNPLYSHTLEDYNYNALATYGATASRFDDVDHLDDPNNANKYQYKISDVLYTNYPTYDVGRYISWMWGQQALPYLQSTYPAHNDNKALTGVKMLNMSAHVEILDDGLPTAPYVNTSNVSVGGVDYHHTSVFEFGTAGTMNAGQGAEVAINNVTAFNATGADSATSLINTVRFTAKYAEEAGLTSIHNDAVSSQLRKRDVSWTDGGNTGVSRLTNTRAIFYVGLDADLELSNDYSRQTATIVSNPLNTNVPAITSTVAVNPVDNTHTIACSATASIKDTVNYTNLVAGTTYELVTTVVKASDPTTVIGTTSTVLVPTTADGSKVVTITVDTSALTGENLVVYEVIKSGATVIASHENPLDADQTVTVGDPAIVPAITATVAVNPDDNTKNIENSANAVIKDTITFTGLTAGTQYTAFTTVVDKTSGAEIVTLRASRFTPTTANGTTSVQVTLDTTAYAEKNLVVYEYLSVGGVIVAQHEDINDADQTVTVKAASPVLVPTITGTVAVNPGDNTKNIENSTSAKIKDTISYTNLTAGTQYTVFTTVVDKTSGTELVTMSGSRFTPATANGTTSVQVTLDTTAYAEKNLVVYEYLSVGGVIVAQHEDINDADQTVTVKAASPVLVPTITGTVAVNPGDNTKNIENSTSAKIKDTISYTNLTAGTEYTVFTTVVDKTSGTELVTLRASRFTPTVAEGTTSVQVTLDTTAYAEKNLVVYEYLSVGGTIVATHEDINDAQQTVTVKAASPVLVPTITGTVATNPTDGTKNVENSTTAKIKDVVTYTNLTVGTQYTLFTTVVDKATGTELITMNGSRFTPTTANGTVDVQVTLNTTAYAEKSLVVYEYLSVGGTIVAQHEDINDAQQTVTVKAEEIVIPPTITRTVAVNPDNATKIIANGASAKIKDTISYTGLTAGTNYTVFTTVVDKLSGTELVTLSASRFTPTAADGTTDVQVTLDTTGYSLKSLVVYEYLSVDGTVVARHEDINDADQTVTVAEAALVPTITRTVAVSAIDNTKIVDCDADSVIKDTITYEGLTANTEYTISTKIVDATTGTALANDLTSKFTPATAAGTIDVLAIVDTTAYAGKKIVFYEYIKLGDAVLARHEDINDANQTVTVANAVSVPTITGTTAVNGVNTVSSILPASATATIKDTIRYSGFTAGNVYKIYTTVVDKSTAAVLYTSTDATAVTWTPTTAAGAYSVNVTLNTLGYAGRSLVVYEDIKFNGATVASHRNINDYMQTVVVAGAMSNPMITRTIATYGSVSNYQYGGYYNYYNYNSYIIANKSVPLSTSAVITDRVYYSGLEDGKYYTVIPALYDRSTGALMTDVLVSPVTFTANNATGYIDVQIRFDSTKYAGKQIVVFETITSNTSFADAKTDLIAEGNTFAGYGADYIAWVKKVEKFISDFRVNDATLSMYVRNALSYNNAVLSFECRDGILGVLNYVTGIGTSNVEVCSHKDLYDADQTLTVASDTTHDTWLSPQITQTVASSMSDSKTVSNSTSTVIKDKIYYTGLTASKIYTIYSTVYDKQTGSAIVTNYATTFIASDLPTYTTVNIPVNTSAYAGRQLVVFEAIMDGSSKICAHEDMYDAGQTVTVEKPNTPTETLPDDPVIVIPDTPDSTVSNDSVAIDSMNRSHTMTFSVNAAIHHTVHYTGLTNGRIYVLESTVWDKSTGAQVGGVTYTTFTADSNRVVETNIPMDTTQYIGKTFVVYAVITQDGREISSYKNMNDEKATVRVSSIVTVLTAGNTTSKTVAASNNTQVIDLVRYTGLTPGRTYKVTGHIVDKEQSAGYVGSAIINGDEGSLVTNGAKILATQVYEFTPTAAEGSISLTFNVNTSALSGRHLVAFETIVDKQYSTVVSQEKNLEDQNQTVVVKTSSRVYTGGEDMTMPFAVGSSICLFAAAGICVFIIRKRKMNS